MFNNNEPKRLTQKRIPFKQKIKLIEEFIKTGEVLTGKTVYKGYPIGVWVIQIRSQIKKMGNGEKKSNIIIITQLEEEMEKLVSLGITERVLGTIDERINMLIEWKAKYPKLKFVPQPTEQTLREYAEDEDSYLFLVSEYTKMRNAYLYVKQRNATGRLSHDNFSRCKEGNVGGVFGYPKRVEELAKRYECSEKEIEYIEDNFGSIDNFLRSYKEGNISGKFNLLLAQKIIKEVIDIDGKHDSQYDSLYRAIIKTCGLSYGVYSSESLRDEIENGTCLNSNQKKVLQLRYGLTREEMALTYEKIGNELNISMQGAQSAEKGALKKLSKFVIRDKFHYDFDEIMSSEYITEDEKGFISEMIKIIEKIRYRKQSEDSDSVKKRFEDLKQIKQRILEAQRHQRRNTALRNLGNIEKKERELKSTVPLTMGEFDAK